MRFQEKKPMAFDKKENISIKGKQIAVDAIIIDGKTIVVTGNLLEIAGVKDEVCDDGVDNPESIINELKRRRKADIFSFDQKLPFTEPKFKYYFEWDNLAVLQVKTFDYWWNKQINNDARRMVRKAEKSGVVVKVVSLTDTFVAGIKSIYDETPTRQGKPFWHYQKDFDTVKKENSTYLQRSEFIGAYYNNELIGFDKIFYTGNRADQIQLISKIKDRDKSPTNALISKAVEVCAQKGISYLTYGKYFYGKRGADSLNDFKKRNGFEQVDIPRYYFPLTLKGKIALKLKLHKGLLFLIPSFIVKILLNIRSKLYSVKNPKELRAFQ
jgi:hypothetical protein